MSNETKDSAPPPSRVVPERRRAYQRLIPAFIADATPLDLRFVGRTALHAALVGATAGLAATGLFYGLELAEALVLTDLVGYVPSRAAGESTGVQPDPGNFKLWLLLFIPALGALLSGLISLLAPITRGGGLDQFIGAYHEEGGKLQRRTIWVKAAATIAALGSGGAGGREGPTTLIGGAIGSTVGAALKVARRERRILMIAGAAAGVSAIFRTPLGAALLAVEVIYRDDFESDALIPALLASVTGYSVFISFHGESTLFAVDGNFPFHPKHLPLYGLLALVVAFFASLYLALNDQVVRFNAWLPLPQWAKPAVGGLVLGGMAVAAILWVGDAEHREGLGIGVLGSGYGAAQGALTGADWLTEDWTGVQILLGLAVAKLVGNTLTSGTGASAGNFAPTIAAGGLLGAAFGHAARLLLDDPSIDPAAFALVGMGSMYGGMAHAPVASLVMVCELAGSYDLLVPLMLAEGLAFVALRRKALYPSQRVSRRDSAESRAIDKLRQAKVRDAMIAGRPFLSFEPATPMREVMRRVSDEASWQDCFPILQEGKVMGVITSETLRVLGAEVELDWAVAADAMQPAPPIHPDDTLRRTMETMLRYDVREVPVTDREGRVVGFLDEADVGRAYLSAAQADDLPPSTIANPESITRS